MNFSLPEELAREFPHALWAPFGTLVAVSGGADSVALLRGMCEVAGEHGRKRIQVLHVDHGVRGEQARSDAEFVRQLASKFGLLFHLVQLPLKERDRLETLSSEQSLRKGRYEAFAATAKKTGARYLVTGHHLNDQIETALFRILRGTGVKGLAGIPKFRVMDDALTIVRPLLNVRREQIENYLRDIGQRFRQDATNESTDYTRNFLRNQVLPLLETKFGDVSGALSRLCERAREIDDFFGLQSENLRSVVMRQTPTEVVVDRVRLSEHPVVLVQPFLDRIWQQQRWPLQAMTAQWWRRITTVVSDANPTSGRLNLPGDITAVFDDQQIRFLRPNTLE